MITIPLTDEHNQERYETLDAKNAMEQMLDRPIEALANERETLITCDTRNSLVAAAHDAFYDHHPLFISPDDIWMCIAQGFTTHVNLHAEELRERFVTHEGKLQLEIIREDFALGQPNPWPEIFEEFSEQIGKHVGQTLRDLVSARFSTTRPQHAIAYDLCMMDGFQGYFEYVLGIGCGIPEIRLLGTPSDWADIQERLRALSEYGLKDWVDTLIPVIKRIEAAARGKKDVTFWNSFFRYRSGSYGNELTGWINTLFPYIEMGRSRTLEPNPYLKRWKKRLRKAYPKWSILGSTKHQGPSIHQIPQALVSAPVRTYHVITKEEVMLRFVGGMMGVHQSPEDLALSATFGWAVVYDS